jgi:hypothetical protein
MTPKRFLRMGGAALITTGLLGVTRVLGRISSASFFNPPYWINWFHLTFGLAVSAVATSRSPRLQTGLTLVAAMVGTTIGLAGLLFGPRAARRFNIPELADPSDHAAHLLVGLVATWGWIKRRDMDANRLSATD